MPRTIAGLVFALVLAGPTVATAQPADTPPARPNLLDVGVRFADLSGDEARAQRFRDLGNGLTLNVARVGWDTGTRALAVDLVNTGRLDQRYRVQYDATGRVRIVAEWTQMPFYVSGDTRTPFGREHRGQARLDEGLRQRVEAGQATRTDVATAARPLDLRSRRDVGRLMLLYTPTRTLDITLDLRTTRRHGTSSIGGSFGFGNTVEVPVPVDTRTTDLATGIEWAGARGTLSARYEGSWFTTPVPSLTFDNPLRISSALTAGAEGRLALPPDNTHHSVATAGSVVLPARSRYTGSIQVGTWRQDEPLLPFSTNPLAPPVSLPRTTAQATARSITMHHAFTSRPTRWLRVNTRVRYEDIDDRRPRFTTDYIRLDEAVLRERREPDTFSRTRRGVDLDATFTPPAPVAVRAGYGRTVIDRENRVFARTTEDSYRASVDSTRLGALMLRGQVEHAVRRGSRLNEDVLVRTGEQPALRHFDLADRDRTRVTASAHWMPAAVVALSASAATGRDDYGGTGFGLRDNQHRTWTMAVDVTPATTVAAGVQYTRDRHAARQRSRAAAGGNLAQFSDPARDWMAEADDGAHVVAATLDLLQAVPRTDVRFSWDLSRSTTTYVLQTPTGSALAPPQPLPAIANDLRTGTADVRYRLTARTAIGVAWWHERYRVDDRALSPDTFDRLDLPSTLFMGWVLRPYTVHAGSVRLIYQW